jgi:hypothetical protein
MPSVSTSDVLLGIVAGGVALTVLYLISEFMSWQLIKNAEARAGLVLREMYKKLHARTKPYLERRKKIRPPNAG